MIVDNALPHIVVAAFLFEAGSDGCTLLLHDSPLICYGFGGANITNKLLYYSIIRKERAESGASYAQELMMLVLSERRLEGQWMDR